MSAVKKYAEDEAALELAMKAAKEKEEAEQKEIEATRMAALNNLFSNHDSNEDDYSFPQLSFDVPDCPPELISKSSVNKLLSHRSDTSEYDNGTDDDLKPMGQQRRRSLSMDKKNEHMAMMKEKLDTLLDKHVNVIETGSFFSLYKLGDVVSYLKPKNVLYILLISDV